MVIKNIFKRLLLISLSLSVAMPAYADWRSSFSAAASWASKKSVSAIANMNSWFSAQKGTYTPDTSAIVTEIAEPISMQYSVPAISTPVVELPIVSEVPTVSAPQACVNEMPTSSWYTPIVNSIKKAPVAVKALWQDFSGQELFSNVNNYILTKTHAAWDILCEYKKPIIGAVAITGLGAFAWYAYNNKKKHIEHIDTSYSPSVQKTVQQQIELLKDELFKATVVADGSRVLLDAAAENYHMLEQGIAAERDRDALIASERNEKLELLQKDIEVQRKSLRESQEKSRAESDSIQQQLNKDAMDQDLQEEYAAIKARKAERIQRMNNVLKRYDKDEPVKLVKEFGRRLRGEILRNTQLQTTYSNIVQIPQHVIDDYKMQLTHIIKIAGQVILTTEIGNYTFETLFELLLCDTNTNKMLDFVNDKRMVKLLCAQLMHFAISQDTNAAEKELAALAHGMITEILEQYDRAQESAK